MPPPTNTELIRALEKTMATIEYQVSHHETGIQKSLDELKGADQRLSQLKMDLALLQENVKRLQEGRERSFRYLSGAVGFILGAIVNVAFEVLRKRFLE